jgi:GT2 family glycosyltransferase
MSALRRITALYAQPAATRITVAVLTHNRVSQVLDTLAKLVALPDQPRIVLVDNASADGTAERVSQRFPSVQVIKSKVNLGAAGRNLGVERVQTEYVAFCDDDTWWTAGSLSRAVSILDAAPNVAVLNARVLVGEEQAYDETCLLMKASALRMHDLPGPSLIGYMAGASVFRTAVFRCVGGYEPRLFIGGEEELVALDVLTRGHAIVYADDIIVHHHPSTLRDSARRRRLLARNAAWVAWLRLPLLEACRTTRRALAMMRREGNLGRDALAMFAALPWALTRRRVIPADVRRMRTIVQKAEGHQR